MESNTFCILPFIHVNSSVTGKMRPCCNTQKYFSFTDKEKTLKEAFQSDEMEELRRQLINGERPEICDVCWKNEDAGIRSQREANNYKFRDYTKETKLKFLDVKFDNKCNLQCRMCDPYSSNQIWKAFDFELPNHLKHIHLSKEEYEAKDNSEDRKKQVLELLPDLTFLKCTGGEPFVSNHFLEVLKEAVDSGHSKHITLSITTNGTKFNTKITEMFEHFEAIDINVSVDGVGETYDYIRYPFKFKQWHERVIDFLTDMEEMEHSNFNIRFSTIVTAYNYLNLCEIQKMIDKLALMFPVFFEHRKAVNFFDFDLKPAESELHAKFLPPHILRHEHEKAKELFQIQFRVRHPLKALLNFEKIHTHTKKDELKRSAIILDKQRKQDYHTLHPLLVGWLDE